MNDLDKISKQAAEFLVQLQGGQQPDQEAFEQWMNASAMHRIVFNDLAEDWQLMPEALQDTAETEDLTSETMTDSQVEQSQGWQWGGKQWLAMAATLILSVGVVLNQFYSASSEPLIYQTAQAPLSDQLLPDGSVVQLNVGSKASIEFTENERLIRLEEGDLAIQVAKDPTRPLVVSYKEHRFTALGTAFTVTTRPKLKLLVTEHTVGVESKDKAQLVVEEGNGIVMNTSWEEVAANDLQEINAWQNSRLIFNDQPFKEVLDTLRPYFSEQLRLMNLSVMNEKVSGSFDMSKPKASLKLIAEGMGLKVKHQPGLIVLL